MSICTACKHDLGQLVENFSQPSRTIHKNMSELQKKTGNISVFSALAMTIKIEILEKLGETSDFEKYYHRVSVQRENLDKDDKKAIRKIFKDIDEKGDAYAVMAYLVSCGFSHFPLKMINRNVCVQGHPASFVCMFWQDKIMHKDHFKKQDITTEYGEYMQTIIEFLKMDDILLSMEQVTDIKDKIFSMQNKLHDVMETKMNETKNMETAEFQFTCIQHHHVDCTREKNIKFNPGVFFSTLLALKDPNATETEATSTTNCIRICKYPSSLDQAINMFCKNIQDFKLFAKWCAVSSLCSLELSDKYRDEYNLINEKVSGNKLNSRSLDCFDKGAAWKEATLDNIYNEIHLGDFKKQKIHIETLIDLCKVALVCFMQKKFARNNENDQKKIQDYIFDIETNIGVQRQVSAEHSAQPFKDKSPVDMCLYFGSKRTAELMKDIADQKSTIPVQNYELNACYILHEINLPMCMCTAPFWNKKNAVNRNIGSLATIILHELTHSVNSKFLPLLDLSEETRKELSEYFVQLSIKIERELNKSISDKCLVVDRTNFVQDESHSDDFALECAFVLLDGLVDLAMPETESHFEIVYRNLCKNKEAPRRLKVFTDQIKEDFALQNSSERPLPKIKQAKDEIREIFKKMWEYKITSENKDHCIETDCHPVLIRRSLLEESKSQDVHHQA